MRPDIDRCPFCQRITKGEFDGSMNQYCIKVVHFEPLNPVTPGHRLFVPARHTEHWETLAFDKVGAAMAAAHQWASELEGSEHLQFNLIVSNGPAATQTVDHVHVHLVPRHEHDGLALPWSHNQKVPS